MTRYTPTCDNIAICAGICLKQRYTSGMSQVQIAMCQIDTWVGDITRNQQSVLAYTRQAYEHGAQVVAFPEMTLTGYPIEDLALRATFRHAAYEAANVLATQLAHEGLGQLYVVVGTVGTDHSNDKPRNRLVVLHEGRVIAGYDKHFLPNYGVFDEYRIFSSGEKTCIIDVQGVRIGFAICEDIWQDGGPVAQLAGDIDVLLTINGSPFEEGKSSARKALAVQRAQEVHAPVLYVNQVGGQDDLVFDGASFAVDTTGSVIAKAPSFMECITYVDIDNTKLHQQATTIASEIDPDQETYSACVLGLRDYMRKNKFTGVTLGLSGGIDSALVATMAADACGGANVHGIAMPSQYSSDGSKDDAAELAQRLGATLDMQPIEPLFNAFQDQIHVQGIAAENLQARIRGVLVMAKSNSDGLLALATGNKSELACGYSTIYGDAVGGYAPIKDILKTRVWQLARWRNAAAAEGLRLGALPIAGSDEEIVSDLPSDGIVIPVSSIEKAPSAELRPGQKDSDSLPEYAMLDRVLAAYIEHAHGRADLLADGFDERVVDTVMRLVDSAEWKRRQYPLGPKVTALAFGRDRRLPVTNSFRE